MFRSINCIYFHQRKKSKGVSFKKQKYHCIYEYPKEPESPTVHGYDLWNSMPEYDSLGKLTLVHKLLSVHLAPI